MTNGLPQFVGSPISVVCIVTRLLAGLFVVWMPASERDFPFSKTSRPTLGPNQPSI